MKKISLKIDLGKYMSVKLQLDEAKKLLEEIVKELNIKSKDINESFRILNNFDEFYSYQQKKFKDYLTPDKDVSDMIKGAVVVDNLKLLKEDKKKYVVITFDRRLKEDIIIKSLKLIGYEPVIEGS
ncbi:MAG: hypothetical protein ACP5I6_02615 [Caldisphaera sp.]|jgi:hypothetical protein|nr:MAG: hypothetical protein C0201_03000 [Caldisphaera sp.]PMP88235.1 MAG: hypothetical protein C0172_03100 [Caldisphaera sp.]